MAPLRVHAAFSLAQSWVTAGAQWSRVQSSTFATQLPARLQSLRVRRFCTPSERMAGVRHALVHIACAQDPPCTCESFLAFMRNSCPPVCRHSSTRPMSGHSSSRCCCCSRRRAPSTPQHSSPWPVLAPPQEDCFCPLQQQLPWALRHAKSTLMAHHLRPAQQILKMRLSRLCPKMRCGSTQRLTAGTLRHRAPPAAHTPAIQKCRQAAKVR